MDTDRGAWPDLDPGKWRMLRRNPRLPFSVMGTAHSPERQATSRGKEVEMLLLILLALLAIFAFGVGFTVHWLFVVAVIAGLLWLISLFVGGLGGRTRTTWW